MENRIDVAQRFASMWRESREEAGKSQDYMAKALGVSKKTVQNWETGTSCPSQSKGFEWFNVLGLQPMPYYMKLLYPSETKSLEQDPSDQTIEELLVTAVKGLGLEQKKKLLYLFTGQHGSSVAGILELMTAHLHSPLRDRINIAQSVSTNYKLAELTDKIIRPDDIQPNLELLDYSIKKGTEAVVNGQSGYTATFAEEEVTL